eukprot:448425-Ditylum_brightwellii.AAC.1
MVNYGGSLEAVDCAMHCRRYDMEIELERCAGGHLGRPHPHQVTYDVAATPLRPKRARAQQRAI